MCNRCIPVMQLVYVNNVHICENAITEKKKKKHTVKLTDEYHVTFQEFRLCWRIGVLQIGDCL